MSDLLFFELKVKSRTTNIQKLKPVDPQTMKNLYAIGYVRTCVDPFRGGGTRGKFGPILGPKNGGFFINYIRIVWFMWDLELVLFYSPKVAFFGKILFFGIIFDFPGVNWAPKWAKTVSFGYVLFPLKDIILFICHLCLMMFYLWSIFQHNLTIFVEVMVPKSSKMGHFMDVSLPWKHLNIYNLGTTNAIKMELTTIIYLDETFHLA